MSESLVCHFARLLRQVHRLRASVTVVVRTLLILEESLIALVFGLSIFDIVVVSISLCCRSHDLARHVQDENGLGLLDDNVDVSLQLLGAEAFFGGFGDLFSLLALGLLVFRGLNEGTGQTALHREGRGVFLLLARGGKLAILGLRAGSRVFTLRLLFLFVGGRFSI